MGAHKICTAVNKRAVHGVAHCDRLWGAVWRFLPAVREVPTRADRAELRAVSEEGRRSRIKPGAAYGTGRSQQPAVRAAFKAFSGRDRGFQNYSEILGGYHIRCHFGTEKPLLTSGLPESQPFQGVGAMSVLPSWTFQGCYWRNREDDPQIKIWRNL